MKPEPNAMARNYLVTALWSSNDGSDDSGGDPLDSNYGIDDIDEDVVLLAIEDCRKFVQKAQNILSRYPDEEMIGYDFWLTRNGHGAGFWDGDYEEVEGDGNALTKIADTFGEIDLYVGDDGVIYSV